MVRQRNRRIYFQSGFFGSFDAPWSERSWIDLFSKETQNPFSDSFGFKNPILDFLKEKHPWKYWNDFLSVRVDEVCGNVRLESVWNNLLKLIFEVGITQLHKLQRVQNAAARLIFEESKSCHVTPLLKSLHWLPVKYRIIFKVILITFKTIHGLAPVYISELISIRDVSLSGGTYECCAA